MMDAVDVIKQAEKVGKVEHLPGEIVSVELWMGGRLFDSLWERIESGVHAGGLVLVRMRSEGEGFSTLDRCIIWPGVMVAVPIVERSE